MRFTWFAAVAAIAIAGQAQAADPALVYDLGGKFDKSFNQAAFEGAERFKAETGGNYVDFEIQNDSQREQAFRKFARDGHNPVIGTGFSMEAAMKKVAAEFPETQFVITGVLGPQSNAHGPNEFLHIPTGKAVTIAIAQIVSDHFERK